MAAAAVGVILVRNQYDVDPLSYHLTEVQWLYERNQLAGFLG